MRIFLLNFFFAHIMFTWFYLTYIYVRKFVSEKREATSCFWYFSVVLFGNGMKETVTCKIFINPSPQFGPNYSTKTTPLFLTWLLVKKKFVGPASPWQSKNWGINPWKWNQFWRTKNPPLIREKNALWMWDFDGEPWTALVEIALVGEYH